MHAVNLAHLFLVASLSSMLCPVAGLPIIDNVLSQNCTGWPEPRRYVEMQSWWTDEGSNIASESKHYHVGACVPIAATITSDTLTLDFALLLHNQQGTGRTTGWFSAASKRNGPTASFVDFGGSVLDFSCNLTDCKRAMRYAVNFSDLARKGGGGNGPIGLQVFAQITAPSTDGLANNLFAEVELNLAFLLDVPSLSSLPKYTEKAENTQVFNWGRRPWQYAGIELTSGVLPPISVSGVLDLALWFGPANRDGLVPSPTNISGIFVAVDPSFHAVPPNLGMVVMNFPTFSRSSLSQSVFIDTRQLSNGLHKVFIRVDSFISAPDIALHKNLARYSKPNKLSGLGGTYSGVLLFTVTVQN